MVEAETGRQTEDVVFRTHWQTEQNKGQRKQKPYYLCIPNIEIFSSSNLQKWSTFWIICCRLFVSFLQPTVHAMGQGIVKIFRKHKLWMWKNSLTNRFSPNQSWSFQTHTCTCRSIIVTNIHFFPFWEFVKFLPYNNHLQCHEEKKCFIC